MVAEALPRPLRVLVAEDDPVQRMLFTAVLRRLGHDAQVAPDGETAVALARELRPDLILLDLWMPGLSGIDACRRILEDAGEPRPGIIFITAEEDESVLATCLEAGGDAFLAKPVSMAVLGAQLRAFGRGREMLHTIKAQSRELQSHQRRIEQEHDMAHHVLRSALESTSEFPSNLATVVRAASRFNGDFIAFAEGFGGEQFVLVGDCTGHGLPAALAVTPTVAIFRSLVRKGVGIESIGQALNRRLAHTLPPGFFVAAGLIEWDPGRQRLSAWNAGLPDMLVLRPGAGVVHRIASRYAPLGVTEGRAAGFTPEFPAIELGDRVVLHSDGLNESRDREGRAFGEDRVAALAGDWRGDGDATPIARLERDYVDFADGRGNDDDVLIAELTCVATASEPRHSGAAGFGDGLGSRVAFELEASALREIDPVSVAAQVSRGMPLLAARGSDIHFIATELLNNAIQHGVLGLSSDHKDCPRGFAGFYAEVRRRLAGLREGWIRFDLSTESRDGRHFARIQVTDSGKGFDPATLRENPEALYGRGLPTIRGLCDRLSFEDGGRSVVAELSWPRGLA